MAPLPELDRDGLEEVAAPVLGPRHVAAGEARLGLGDPARRGRARDAITSLCGDAHAAIWLPRGREAKYASLSARVEAVDRAGGANRAVLLEPAPRQRGAAGGVEVARPWRCGSS